MEPRSPSASSAQNDDDGSSPSRNHRPTAAKSYFKSQQDKELIRLALHNSPFFTCLDEEQVERLVSVARKETFEPGTIVILEGCVDEDGEDGEDDELLAVPEDATESSSSSSSTGQDLMDEDQGPAEADDFLLVENHEHVHPDDLDSTHESEPGALKGSRNERPFHQAHDVQAPEADTDENDFDTHEITMTLPQQAADDSHVSQAEPSQNVLPDKHDDVSSPHPPPPRSGKVRSIYIVKEGKADVWYQSHINPASLGPGTLFGEGGFLFGRQHSASVVAGRPGHHGTAQQQQQQQPLECWVVDLPTFRHHVLPSSETMQRLFHRYAQKRDRHGVLYMTMEDFVHACQHQDELSSSSSSSSSSVPDPLVSLRIATTYNVLRRRDRTTTTSDDAPSKIYLDDFCLFHLLMARPDPEVDIAFLLMDQRQTGQIFLPDLAAFLEPVFPGLDFTADFFQRYFGQDGDQSIRAMNFSQFLVDLHREIGKQTFWRAVEKKGTPLTSSGRPCLLAPEDFVHVLKTSTGGWSLPLGVADRLDRLFGPTQHDDDDDDDEKSPQADKSWETHETILGDRYLAYGDFLAFQEVLANLPGICNLIARAQEIKQGPVSPDDFKVANRVMGLGGRLSRRQVDIIFLLFDLDRDGYVSQEDTVRVCGVDFSRRLVAVKGRQGKLTFAPPPEYRHDEISTDRNVEAQRQDFVVNTRDWLHHWSLTAVAGAMGIVALYPLDLIKTRLMNQRLGLNGRRMYMNSLECFQQAVRTEGFLGLYRGLTPQLLGVAPEKAIKLQVNDLLRQVFSSRDEETGKPRINLGLEVLAGACAGACQLLVTNPMEISKIRLQLQGETARLVRSRGMTPPAPQTFVRVFRDLGFPGVYRGASACLLRDMPFGAIYFPCYAWMKNFLARQNENSGVATSFDLLTAGTLAGVPAALLTSPADVIKTRLQSVARPGETAYAGIRDCATKIYRQEGSIGFFQGAGSRVFRIAPQFGISLLAYEKLAELVGLHGNVSPTPPTNAFVEPFDYRSAFPAQSIRPQTDGIQGGMQNDGHGGRTQGETPAGKGDQSG